jgi:hypothetical protein
MASNDTDLSELKRRAEAVGLTRLTAAHLEQLQRATASIGKMKAKLSDDLTVADEPAHVYSLKGER